MFSWPVRAVVVTMPWLVAGGMVGAVRVVRVVGALRRFGALEVADEGGERIERPEKMARKSASSFIARVCSGLIGLDGEVR